MDIGSAHSASLDALAFEGATKRNKPTLKARSRYSQGTLANVVPQVGSLVYARVSLANRDMEPEVECIDPTTHKADGFGELKSGFIVKCSLGFARA